MLSGTTVLPRYLFVTVPVPSRSRYYRGTAIPQIPRYYRTYCSVQLKRDWCTCAALCYHVSDSSLSLTLPTLATNTGNQLLIAVTDYCASTPSTTLDASVISDKGYWCKRTYTVGWTIATLLAGTADVVIKRLISSEYRCSFSIRNNFPGPISLLYAAYTGFWCSAEAFPSARTILSLSI